MKPVICQESSVGILLSIYTGFKLRKTTTIQKEFICDSKNLYTAKKIKLFMPPPLWFSSVFSLLIWVLSTYKETWEPQLSCE